MDLAILGMGTANPESIASQPDAAEVAQTVVCETREQAAILKVIYRRCGVKKRHIALTSQQVLEWFQSAQTLPPSEGTPTRTPTLGGSTQVRMQLYKKAASPLALSASRSALIQARVAPHEITHLVTVSCTGFAAPGVDIDLIQGLELRNTVERTHVGFMSCHGALNGLRVARQIGASDPKACILLCAVELCTLHYRLRWDPVKILGNAFFGDGAAALVARPTQNRDSDKEEWKSVANGSCLIPNSLDGIQWNVGDHGFEIELSPKVPDIIQANLRRWLESWLNSQNLRLDQIASWAVHPGGPRILSSVEEALSLPKEATSVSREVLAEFGNMSSPTVLFILERLRLRHAPRPCVALAFGPGLATEAVLFR